MANTLKHKLAKLPAARRNKINKRASELITKEVTLRDLQKALCLRTSRQFSS